MSDHAPVRVLRLITRLNIGGPSIQAITLSERLTARGFDTLLLHGELGPGEGDMSYLLPASVHARQFPALRRAVSPFNDATALVQIYRAVCQFRPAILHTHMAKAGMLGRLAAIAYNQTAGRGARVRLVHTYHGHVLEGYFNPAKTRVFIGIERRLAPWTDRIIAISPQIRTELLEEHRIGRLDQYRVVPLGFDLTGLAAVDEAAKAGARATLGIAPDAQVVTTVGRLTAIKQHRLFLETARLVANGHPRAMFLIAGDGELRRELEALARSLGIADRTRFLGWRRDLATIYGASDVFLLTSRNEGTPVALIESLAAGVPGVSTDVGGVKDVIDSDAIGSMAPFGDAPALAAHVATLLDDDARRHRMGIAGRHAALGRYGIDRLTNDVEHLYREALQYNPAQ
jgi:glycosyltransferase involved in cell wall biosynthesis